MAKVLLTSVALMPRVSKRVEEYLPKIQGPYREFEKNARIDSFGVHELVDDPEEAEIIIFIELRWHGLFAERIRWHPLFRRYREKCFLFDFEDFSLPFLPGVYASLRRQHHDPSRTRAGYYVAFERNPYIDFRPVDPDSPYLGSFIGSFKNSPVRGEIGKLPTDRFLLVDTSAYSKTVLAGETAAEERHRFWSQYADAMEAGKFSLCPRGIGPGSIRVFESMQMGRCPVILSDEWVLPPHVDWPNCSIVLPEKDASHLPEILEAKEDQATVLGQNARLMWEKYYSPSVQFHWLVETCLELKQARRLPEAIAGRLIWRHAFSYRSFRRYLTSKRQIFEHDHKILP